MRRLQRHYERREYIAIPDLNYTEVQADIDYNQQYIQKNQNPTAPPEAEMVSVLPTVRQGVMT